MEIKNKFDPTTSTERLLDLIRGKSDGTEIHQAQQPVRPIVIKTSKLVRPKSKTNSQSVTVGIDIGYENLNLVKAAGSAQTWKILECKSIPIPSDIEKGSDAFNAFLKSAVVPFCSGANRIETWAIMSSAEVEVRLIRIPKVPAKNIEATVFWTLKKEVAINDTESFLDYEVRGQINESGIEKLNVMCYVAPLAAIEETRKLFSKIGVQLAGVSIISFAVQNIFLNNVMPLPEKQTACLFIGNNYSRIDLYTDRKLTMTRDIMTGITSIVETLIEDINSLTSEGGKHSHEEARQILFAFTQSSTTPLVLADGLSVEREKVDSIVSPVQERIVRQIERTFEHFTSTLGYDRVEKIYISSVMPVSKAMVDYCGAQLGIECEVFDPLEQVLQTSSFEKRNSFIPALGIALSDNAYTPNFLHSFKDKKKAEYVVKFNKAILICLIVSLLACSAIFAYEWLDIGNKKAELARLEQQLQKNSPLVSKETFLQIAAAAKHKQQNYVELSHRYVGMALIGELSSLTPESVSLTSLRADFAEKPKGNTLKSEHTSVVEGIINGNENMLQTLLASYVMKLRSSPMFSEVNVSSSKIETSKQGSSLTFVLNLKLGPNK
ncbi:MAG: pilus assembly protein PilM [Dissulfurispiraceae bacterium]